MTIEKMEKANQLKQKIERLEQITGKLNEDWTGSGQTQWGIVLGQLPPTGPMSDMLLTNSSVHVKSGIFVIHSEDGSEGCNEMAKFRDYLRAYFEGLLDAAQDEFDAL